jgi:hypothetical protein
VSTRGENGGGTESASEERRRARRVGITACNPTLLVSFVAPFRQLRVRPSSADADAFPPKEKKMTLEVTRTVLMWCTRWFHLSREQFDAIHYGGMSIYKIGIVLFNLVPFVVLSLLG